MSERPSTPPRGGDRRNSMSELTEQEREALAQGLRSKDGCWDGEECCWASFDAMVPAVAQVIKAHTADLSARVEAVERVADEINPWTHPAMDQGDIYRRLRAALAPHTPTDAARAES